MDHADANALSMQNTIEQDDNCKIIRLPGNEKMIWKLTDNTLMDESDGQGEKMALVLSV